MAEAIAFENGRISNSEGLVTLTLVRVILHTVVHQCSDPGLHLPPSPTLESGGARAPPGYMAPVLMDAI